MHVRPGGAFFFVHHNSASLSHTTRSCAIFATFGEKSRPLVEGVSRHLGACVAVGVVGAQRRKLPRRGAGHVERVALLLKARPVRVVCNTI